MVWLIDYLTGSNSESEGLNSDITESDAEDSEILESGDVFQEISLNSDPVDVKKYLEDNRRVSREELGACLMKSIKDPRAYHSHEAEVMQDMGEDLAILEQHESIEYDRDSDTFLYREED